MSDKERGNKKVYETRYTIFSCSCIAQVLIAAVGSNVVERSNEHRILIDIHLASNRQIDVELVNGYRNTRQQLYYCS